MAPLACLLEEQGHRVRGCDAPLYPPMSDLLDEAGIDLAAADFWQGGFDVIAGMIDELTTLA